MTFELLASLGALALIDSLSVGTLLIPVFFLIAPRLRAGRMLVYLGTIGGFYFVVGVVLLLGAVTVLNGFGDVLETGPALMVQLVLGAALLVLAFLMPSKPKAPGDGPGRLARWRERALEGPNATAVVVVALAAGLLELATMLPYLGAIGLLSTASVAPGERLVVLAAYCGVMIAPALVLLALRLVAKPLVEPPLRRLAAWLERTGPETTAWIVGIVGFLLLRDAASRLGLLQFLDSL